MLLFLQIEHTTVLDCDFLELRSIRNNFLSPPQRTGEFAPTKTLSFLDSGIKWRDFRPEITSGTGTDNLKNQDTILNVTSGVLYFVGDSLVPDTIDKTAWRKVLLSYYLTSSSEVVLPIEESCVSRDGLVLMGESYGIHLSSLNKLNARDGLFKLSRYISGPDIYTVKPFELLLLLFPWDFNPITCLPFQDSDGGLLKKRNIQERGVRMDLNRIVHAKSKEEERISK
uniref:Uncharacterized protein n=1 Tax=Solanum tuberosum TaxID=4113 RepID=M1BJ49_SOLTU